MPAILNNKQKAESTAIERGAAALAQVDMNSRCRMLRLAPPAADGSVTLPVLGKELRLLPPAFQIVRSSSFSLSAEPPDKLKLELRTERLLAIHYLLCDLPVEPTGEWISFRDFPGGQFYWTPFCSRSIDPLITRIGNDLDLLRQNMRRLGSRASGGSDVVARVRALGAIEAMLIYRPGDEELAPSAELLFDACARRALCAEDAAVLASRICLSLL
jgi:hypothetical protein